MHREKISSVEVRDGAWRGNYRVHGSKDVPTQIKVVAMEAVKRTGDVPSQWTLRALLDDSLHHVGQGVTALFLCMGLLLTFDWGI